MSSVAKLKASAFAAIWLISATRHSRKVERTW